MLKWALYAVELMIGSAAVMAARRQALREKDEIPPEALRAGHETRDVSALGVAIVGGAMILAAVGMHLGMGVAFHALRARYGTGQHLPAATPVSAELVGERLPPPPPLLQLRPPAEYRAYELSQRRALQTYDWIDPKTKTVRIPIERAMEILANGR